MPESPQPHATMIRVTWSDGLCQRFDFQPDSTWTLMLSGPAEGSGPRVTGYRQDDLKRVLSRVIEDTAEGQA